MGCGVSSGLDHSTLSDVVDDDDYIKIVLCGGGETGKSTLVKQMRVINGEEIEPSDFIAIVRMNLLCELQKVIGYLKTQNVDIQQQDCFDLIGNSRLSLDDYTKPDKVEPLLASIRNLLAQPPVIEAAAVGYKFNAIDNAVYFFKDFERIWGRDYLPTSKDILRSRLATTGLPSYRFKYKHKGDEIPVHMFDVGGQRNERKQWINALDDVTMLLCVISLTEYSQTLTEGGKSNRFEESLNILEGILAMPSMNQTPVLVFLNKLDIFEDRLQKESPSAHFEDYETFTTRVKSKLSDNGVWEQSEMEEARAAGLETSILNNVPASMLVKSSLLYFSMRVKRILKMRTVAAKRRISVVNSSDTLDKIYATTAINPQNVTILWNHMKQGIAEAAVANMLSGGDIL